MQRKSITPPPAAAENAESPLASFDLGNATAKIKTATLSTEFRSIAGRLSTSRRLSELKSPLVFTYEKETLVFGDDTRDLIDGHPVAYTDMTRYTSGFYRKLFAAALWRSFQHLAADGVLYPTIVCSIPATEYANGKADDVKAAIGGPYALGGLGGKTLYVTIKPKNLIIIPEGAGSYFETIADGSGLGGREVAILDIGFYTTDLVIFNKGNYVAGSAHSTEQGVSSVARHVQKFLKKKYSYRGDLWAVDSALDAGVIDIGHRCESFVSERDAAYANLLDDLLGFYFSSKGNRMPAAVRLSGGGAKNTFTFVPDDLKGEGWATVRNDPRRSNVEGAFDFLQKRQNKAK